jgi:hypothetical protein
MVWHMEAVELSVVVCTLGDEEVVDTVESILESGRLAGRQVEVVVVWQGVGDSPSLGEQVQVVEAFPAGLSHARNRGLVLARGPLVAFVDDDEVVDPAWVGALFAAFERNGGLTAVFGPIAARDERGLPYCRYDDGGEYRIFSGDGTRPWGIGTGGNMAFRRDALLAVGGFDVLFGAGSVSRSAEDTEAIFRLLRSGHTLAWTPDAVVYHPTKTVAERLTARFPYAYGMGKLARRHRDPVLAARYGKSIGEALIAAGRARDRRRLREAGATLRGFVTGFGLRSRPVSPQAALELAPENVATMLTRASVEPLAPTFRPDPHFLYQVDSDRILHVYVNPTPRLKEGLAVRERARAVTGLSGIPLLLAQGEAKDTLWVLEERLHGSPPHPGDPRPWFATVVEWALVLGATAKLPVRKGAWWSDKASAAVDAAPLELRTRISAALDAVGELPARRLHGDFQRKNIFLDGKTAVGVLDWEHAYDDGLPGLDLLFLAVMARGELPDRELLLALVHGRDPSWAPLGALLRRAGVESDTIRSYLLAALAVWAGDENGRVASPGLPRSDRIYGRLLRDLGPSLA